MNKQRRKVLNDYIKELYGVKEKLEEIKGGIESVRDEEDDSYSNLPEGLMYSEKGDIMQENIDSMDNIGSNIDDVISQLDDTIDELQEIIDK